MNSDRNKWHRCGPKTDHHELGERIQNEYAGHKKPKNRIVHLYGYARYCAHSDDTVRVWTSHRCHVLVDVKKGRIHKVGMLKSDESDMYYAPMRLENKIAEDLFRKAFDRACHQQPRGPGKKGAQPHHGCLICGGKERKADDK